MGTTIEAPGLPLTRTQVVSVRPAMHIPNGAAVAATLAAVIGLLALAVVTFASEASAPFKDSLQALGKLWMPGAAGIGPYSGKETCLLLSWLGSWALLHLMLKRKQINGVWWLVVLLVGIGAATTVLWPPVWHLLLRKP